MSASLPFCYRCYTNHRAGPCPEDRKVEDTRQLALDYVAKDSLWVAVSDDTERLYGGVPPHERVATSEAAALSMKPVTGKVREAVYQAIAERQGVSDDDLEVILGMKHQTVSARRRELYLLGKIVSIGERPTRSGRMAKVWVAR